jgi:hypothetical protein
VVPFLFGNFVYPSSIECVASAAQRFKSAMFLKMMCKQKDVGGCVLQ